MKASLLFALISAAALHAQPSIVPGGVLNAASFAKDSSGQGTPVAPGSLVAIFGSGLGASTSEADTIPYSTALGGLTVSFNGVAAPLQNVIPAAGIITAQVPFEVLPSGQGTAQVPMAVTINGQTANTTVTVVPAAPGVFTLPSGVGYAVLVNLTDGSVAAPGPTVPGGFTLVSHPISRGQSAYFYVTGLGAMTPLLADGAGINPTLTQVNANPIVWIGGVNSGVTAPIAYAGPSGYPGVYQVNITIPANAPTGNNIVFQVQSADGSQVSPAGSAMIAIQ